MDEKANTVAKFNEVKDLLYELGEKKNNLVGDVLAKLLPEEDEVSTPQFIIGYLFRRFS